MDTATFTLVTGAFQGTIARADVSQQRRPVRVIVTKRKYRLPYTNGPIMKVANGPGISDGNGSSVGKFNGTKIADVNG